jgi:hypothetical protein
MTGTALKVLEQYRVWRCEGALEGLRVAIPGRPGSERDGAFTIGEPNQTLHLTGVAFGLRAIYMYGFVPAPAGEFCRSAAERSFHDAEGNAMPLV